MVFIKNSNKVQAFLKACAQNTTISVDLNAKYYPLSSIESILSQWNEKNPQNLYFLNEMIEFEDILFTLEHKAIEREQEFNTPEWIKEKERMRAKKEEREYQKMISTHKNPKTSAFSLLSAGESVKDFEKSVSFGVSFIFSLFLSGLSGFYFGIYILGASTNKSLIIAAIATIATTIMETTLFIIKINKQTKKEGKQKVF